VPTIFLPQVSHPNRRDCICMAVSSFSYGVFMSKFPEPLLSIRDIVRSILLKAYHFVVIKMEVPSNEY
jgi:hypothetical protein